MADWRTRAACRGADDPESFFPVNESGSNAADARLIADAKAICGSCPVAASCLAWALDNGCTHGVWGGTTGDERAKIIKRGGRDTAEPQQSDEVLVDRARRGLPVRVRHDDRRSIVAALPDVSELRLARAFGVDGKTIYNDRQLLNGETPQSWSWRQRQGAMQ